MDCRGRRSIGHWTAEGAQSWGIGRCRGLRHWTAGVAQRLRALDCRVYKGENLYGAARETGGVRSPSMADWMHALHTVGKTYRMGTGACIVISAARQDLRNASELQTDRSPGKKLCITDWDSYDTQIALMTEHTSLKPHKILMNASIVDANLPVVGRSSQHCRRRCIRWHRWW